MKAKQVNAIKSILGKDIFDVLEKTELYKPQTKTTLDPSEIRIAMEIVPRTILTYLITNLKPLKSGEIKELDLPFANGKINVNKLSNDVYNGEIYSEGKVVYEFKYRSLPSIGLIILSTFELYDIIDNEIAPSIEKQNEVDSKICEIQKIIDERLQLHSLIRNVVDQKISEREALQQMLLAKLKHSFEEQEGVPVADKKLKLKEFLENRQKKVEDKLDKSENLKCSDCNTTIYKSGENHIKCCICYGEFHNKNIKIEKNENTVRFKFPKGFDQENIEMLLDSLKKIKK